jgi:hypothetical protein
MPPLKRSLTSPNTPALIPKARLDLFLLAIQRLGGLPREFSR